MTRLLLLEDDPILHEIIAEYLEEHGYEVDGYFDGEQALQAIMDGGHAMLILDVRVPELDGFELLEYLRDIRNTTPAIFITSLSGIKDLQKGFRLGANDYLKKPFELDELRIRIEHQLTATLTLRHSRLSICDTGIGITPDAQADIFRRYQRANKEEGGFGIGLSIVHRICEEYTIPLSLDSTVGSGSCFHLDLRSCTKDSGNF